jgi:hypothetical protein
MRFLEELRAAAGRPIPRWAVGALAAGLALASAWSLARLPGERAPGGVVTPSSEPKLTDLAPPHDADKHGGVGTVHEIGADRTVLVLWSNGKPVSLELGTPAPPGIGRGDVVEYRGRRTGGSRFGAVYLTGTFTKISSAGPPASARPGASGAAPKLDDVWKGAP